MTEDNISHDKIMDNLMNTSDRISVMEQKYKVVEDHTVTVSRLSSKVSLLLTIMSFAVLIVSGAAVYTFTGLNKFKELYHEDRLGFHQMITETQLTSRDMITDSIDELENAIDGRIDNFEDKMEARMDSIEKQCIELNSKIRK